MASAWVRASILLRDQAGNIAKAVVLVAAAALDPSGGAVAALRAAIQAVTKALSPRAETGSESGPSGGTSPGTGDYDTIEDRATFTFRADDNSTMTYELPSPKPAIFVTNSDRVDLTNADVLAFTDFITANCSGRFGQTINVVKGHRTRKKQMKV
jgi:hypothetical protein